MKVKHVTDSGRLKLIVMFLMTATFMVTEMVVGYCGDSLTLVADSFHMLNDVAALVVAFVTSMLSTKSWCRSTFGWARADILGAMANSMFLLALALSILLEALKRFVHPEPVLQPQWVFSVGVCGLIINIIGLVMFKDHAHNHSGGQHLTKIKIDPPVESKDSTIVIPTEETIKKGSQMNMRGVFLHVLADTMASIAVLISAAIVWITEDKRKDDVDCWKYIDYIDPALSVLIVFLIFISTVPLLCEASLILIQAVPPNLIVEDIRKDLESTDGVIKADDLHIWQLTASKVVASVHLKCADLKDYGRITIESQAIFRKYDIHSTTIQGEIAEPGLEQSLTSNCTNDSQ